LYTIPFIAIDGPAASGKTTVGKLLAQRLDYLLLDTGSMYRAVTLAALRSGVDVDNEAAVVALAEAVGIEIEPAGSPTDGRSYTVLLDGDDVTWEIRSPAVDTHVSQVSAYAGVREELVRRQRELGHQGQVVMVGRDIGTVVLPNAPLKLYITASAQERARRRWRDRQQQGHTETYEEILADVVRRDEFDSNRRHSPLRPADDAIIIDTTNRTPEAIVDEIVALIEERMVTVEES
jgi:cytidylate kinase